MNKPKLKQTERVLVAGITILLVASTIMVLLFVNLNKTVSANPVRVACIGDSITEGIGYPKYLQSMLGSKYVVGNFGVGGSTALLGLYTSYMNQSEFQRAKDFAPNIVVVMFGTNDASPDAYQNIDNFVADYKKMAGEFQAIGSNPKIWVAKPPPIFNNAFGPNSTNLVQGIIPGIEQVANELNLPIIDIYTVLANHPEDFAEDGVHPNLEGAKIIATLVHNAITFTNAST
jgi:lysophospholipase L1-like esterase